MKILTCYFNDLKVSLKVAEKEDFDFDFGTMPREEMEQIKKDSSKHLYAELLYIFVKDVNDNLALIIGCSHCFSRHRTLFKADTNGYISLNQSDECVIGGGECHVTEIEKGDERMHERSVKIPGDLGLFFYSTSGDYGKISSKFLAENGVQISTVLKKIFERGRR